MRKTLVVLLLPLLCGCVAGGPYMRTVRNTEAVLKPYKKVAVLPEYTGATEQFITEGLITELISLDFDVVERTNIASILSESKMRMSGMTQSQRNKLIKAGEDLEEDDEYEGLGFLDQKALKEIGKLLGVDAIIFVYVIPTWNGEVSRGTFRFVDTNTGLVVFSTTFVNNGAALMPSEVFLCSLRAHLYELLVKNKVVVRSFSYTAGKIKLKSSPMAEKEKSPRYDCR